jgi:hypothetical protein
LVWTNASAPAGVAMSLLSLVGLVVEALICHELRRKWAGEAPGTVREAFERLGEHQWLYNFLSLALMTLVFGVVAYLGKGRSIGLSLLGTMVGAAIFVAVGVLIEEAVERLRP